MSLIQFTITTLEEAVDELLKLMKEAYGKEDIDVEVETDISKILNSLQEDLQICIEYPYVDKFYRDTYYTYFSSKHNEYPRDCIRVSIFDSDITGEHFKELKHREKLGQSFKGFFIIRPTFPNVIGRTLISRKAYKDNDFLICAYKENVLINGIKLNVEGFPFSSQDGEAITCAETSIWALMEYFSHKYADYVPAKPSTIIHTLNKYSKERQLPSSGLNVNEISFALKEFGFGTLIYESETYDKDFFNIISTYIESGIPIVSFIKIKNQDAAHANILIGHEVDGNLDFSTVNTKEIEFNFKHPKKPKLTTFLDYGDVPKRFIVNDDNLRPYEKIVLDNPAEHLVCDNFDDYYIGYIIVPLYNKIYLDVVRAKPLILNILKDENLGFAFNDGFIFRMFLTSSRSFKEHISNNEVLNSEIKKNLILAKMPKFVWIAEIYEKEDFLKGIPKGLIVIDATEANEVWLDAMLFVGYPDRCIIKFGKDFVTLPFILDNYTKYSNNLK